MKKSCFILSAMLTTGIAFSQQEYSYTFFGDNNSFFNPAATGVKDYATLTGQFRKQWFKFSGSPTSGGVTYEAPLKKYNMGLGGILYQDHVGVTDQTNAAAMYSYHIRLNEEHTLSFGINAGIDVVNTKYDRLVYWDMYDEVFGSDYINFVVPHFGIGAFYSFHEFYAGVSIPRMVSINANQFNSVNFTNAPSLVSHYYATTGYKFRLDNDFSLKTALLLKYTNNVKPQLDISLLGYYKNTIGLGVAYKSLGFASAFLQYNYKDAVVFAYGFDLSLNPLYQHSKGSHEIMLQYRFGFKSRIPKDAPSI